MIVKVSENMAAEVHYFQQAASWRISYKVPYFTDARYACLTSMSCLESGGCSIQRVIDDNLSIKSTLDLAKGSFTWLGALTLTSGRFSSSYIYLSQ